jgi:hypothetical protein
MLIKTTTKTPTDTKGTRVKAETVEDGNVSRVIAWDHGLDRTANHERAALNLLSVLGLEHLTLVHQATRKGVLFWSVEGPN